jgi:hypothetical protein
VQGFVLTMAVMYVALKSGRVGKPDRTVEGPLRGDGHAVVKGRTFVQLEGDGGVRDVPILEKLRRKLVAIVGEGAIG